MGKIFLDGLRQKATKRKLIAAKPAKLGAAVAVATTEDVINLELNFRQNNAPPPMEVNTVDSKCNADNMQFN